MRILRLTTLLDFGGQEKQYLSFTERPELLHNQYIFAAIGYGGNAEKTLKERGFEVHILNGPFSIKNISNIWYVYRLIKKVKPDVVHTAAAEANFHGVIAAKLAGVKTIIGEEIGIPNHSIIAQKVFSLVYRLADKVIGVSKSVKEHLVKTGEIPDEKGVVLYNPVSQPKIFPRIESDRFNMVYVGRLEKVKNVELLLRAFSRMEKKNVQLTIVGDGRERHNLEQLASELRITHQVLFTGFSEEPSQYVCYADLFILPSYSEGFGIAAVEAMFLKVPVLSTNVGGVPEFITDGENGFLFNPKDEDELQFNLVKIIHLDKIALREVGERGYASAIHSFTVERYVKNLEKLYETQNASK